MDFNSIHLVRQQLWKLLAAPYCRRVVQTKSRQNRTFDPGGSQGHLRASRFRDRGARGFVVRLYVLEQLKRTAAVFLRIDDSGLESLQESRASKTLCRTYSVFS